VSAVFDPTPILTALVARKVSFVVIGGFAARMHGSPLLTADVDITPDMSADNLSRLSDALRDLDARVRHPDVPEGLPFSHDATSLAGSTFWNLTTVHGDLDLSFTPAGSTGYSGLAPGAVRMRIGAVEFDLASLADVVHSKDAAGRPKDHRALPVLRELLAQQREQRRAH
jgi:hypothetical protein